MTTWRWDQGRVLYFQFDVLREIAKVLVTFEGKDINDNSINDELRKSLRDHVGLPFAPDSYKINRNYSRVFQCALLAYLQGKSLYVSDICKMLAADDSYLSNCDNYMYEVFRRFRFPFPAFNEYEPQTERVYPFCAIIKYLIALREQGRSAKVSLEDICSYVIGNSCTGLEDVDFYNTLQPTTYRAEGDSVRQLREMLAFISQCSFLKVFNKELYLDVYGDDDIKHLLQNILIPNVQEPMADKGDEFCQMTKVVHQLVTPNVNTSSVNILSPLSILDKDFTEGKRVRVQHLRIERSTLLRRFYISLHPEPVCEACKEHVREKYPWVDYMLDVHHLLPLASVIKLSIEGTSLDDMVGLCPSCHKAIHDYYRKWLKSNNLDDFRSKQEAMSVYLEAVREIA